MDPAAYPTGVTAPQNSTTTVLSPEQHWYILADHLVGDVSHWLDDQNQIVLSIAVCFIGLWIMVLGEITLQLAWLAVGALSGFYVWYLPVTEWYLPSLATPEAFRIITAVVCGGLGGWIAYLFRLGALFIVNLLFIAPLTFLILTAFIDLSPSQDWLQIRLVLSLLFGTIVSAGVVKGRKIGLRVICVLSGSFLVATTAGFLAEEIEDTNYEDSQPILWRGCVESCLVDAPEVLSNPSDADVSCLTFFMVWTVLAISTLLFQFITQTSICCAAKNRAEQRVQNPTTLSRPLLSSRTPQQRRSSKPKWVPQCCVEFWYSLRFCGLRVIPTCFYTIYYACGGCLRVCACLDSTRTNIGSTQRLSNSIPPPAPQNSRNRNSNAVPSAPSFGEAKPSYDIEEGKEKKS